MDNRKSRTINRKFKKRTKSFTEALKEKYCVEDEPTFDFIIVSPKRKSNATEAELAHLRTVVLNEMDVSRADIPHTGLTSLCPNVVDLDLANNLLESWVELLDILAGLPRVKYVNVSMNKLRLDQKTPLPTSRLSVENLALNCTGSSIKEVVTLSELMPGLKELHLCGNEYEDLADIDRNIQDGAFSALECLRLNNNGITSWSEVWKLRMLPRLKFLILSGNPVQNIFYTTDTHNDDKNKQTEEAVAMDTKDDLNESANADRDNRDLSEAEDPDDSDEQDNGHNDSGELDNCHDDSDELLVDEDDIDTEYLAETNGYGDDEEGGDSWGECRPVSRLDHHRDIQLAFSDDSSDTEQDATMTDTKTTTTHSQCSTNTNVASSNINIPQGANKKSMHNVNYNNSRNSRLARDSPFDGSSSDSSTATPLDLGLPGFPGGLPGNDSDGEAGEDNSDDWPRLAAEQFLYDLIDQLDLGETSTVPSSSTSSQPSSSSSLFTSSSSWFSSQLFSVSASQASGTRVTTSATVQHPPPPPTTNTRAAPSRTASTDTNQNAASSGNSEDYISRMLAAINDDSSSSDTEENVFAKIYSDDDFIPRSVSMLDDPSNPSSPFMPQVPGLGNLTKSAAKRRLFDPASVPPGTTNIRPSLPSCAGSVQRSTVVANSSAAQHQTSGSCSMDNQPVPAWNAAPPERSSQSESDSCSDCEAEQHSLAATLRRELADLASSAVQSVDGPDSWLEVNRSFATSMRDTGDGYTTAITHTSEGRVVVTGLASSENPEPSSVKESDQLGQGQNSAAPRLDNDTTMTNSTNSVTPTASESPQVPFQHLQMLCLSNACLSHWEHLHSCGLFPNLNNIRLKNNPLFSSVNNDDKRKLYIASLPRVTVLNGSEVTATEREKAERFYLRFFMDEEVRPGLYSTLVAKHGPPVKLVDIDLRAGYQEWATLTFKCEGAPHFTRRLHLVEPVARLRSLVSQVLGLPKWCFLLHHHPCGPSHPESERELVELRCEALPMSRFDFAEGDEIIVEVRG